jgi:hypothetical protein
MRLILFSFAAAVAAWPFAHFRSQLPLQLDEVEKSAHRDDDDESVARLHGRFLHITGMSR